MLTHWKLHMRAAHEDQAERILHEVFTRFGVSPPHELHTPGDPGIVVAAFSEVLPGETYEETVFHALGTVARLGSGFFVTGDVRDEISITLKEGGSARIDVDGLILAKCTLRRP